ncbi:hypothetical protein PPERSA_05622 [Pseudocohnilembus persalinus]|uniref:TmcB/TmcC TPR repeats domain-containing protein n=1 Tax=Pseudocohnilembus persalinus TaxID=266149 RepID=A0A0V0QG69_PSEPJ|nr:hypothetical protein PPERSA_05622 [Pseudocohnilembus persalinus]|eukprot:KRX01222.1 hypothetical protein PPERSA_05622 [Pseudocohnilembus persalinus]
MIQEQDDQRGSLEQQMNKLKINLFRIFLEVGECSIISSTIMKIFMILEALQIVYYSIHESFQVSDSKVLDVVYDVIKFFQANTLLNEGDNVANSILTYTFLVLLVFNMVALILLILKQNSMEEKKEKSFQGLYSYFIKILNLYFHSMATFLAIPMFNTFSVNIFCNNDSPAHQGSKCFSGLHIANLSFSIIGIIIALLFLGLQYTFFINFNPFSKNPIAGPASKILLIKICIKIYVVVYQTIDFGGSIWKYFLVGLFILQLILLIIRYQSISFYNQSLTSFNTKMEIIVFWVNICIILQSLINTTGQISDKEFFYIIIFTPFLLRIQSAALTYRDRNYLLLEINQLKKAEDVEKIIVILIQHIENPTDIEGNIFLEGYIRMHTLFCTKSQDQCPCQKICNAQVTALEKLRDAELKRREKEEKQNNNKGNEENYEDDDLSQKQDLMYTDKSQSIKKSHVNNEFGQEDELEFNIQKNWYIFLISQLDDALDVQKSSKLFLLESFILTERLNNIYKSLKQLMLAETCKPKISESFAILQTQNMIEENIITEDMRNEQNRDMDVTVTVHFEQQFVQFMKYIEKSVEVHLDFWQELLDKNPEVQKLQILGMQITSSIDKVEQEFKNLKELNENNIRTLINYGFFIRDVVNDETEANKQFVDNQKSKFGENSNCGIIIMSANLKTRYHVKNINYDTTRLYQFTKYDLLNQNIKKKIMPRQFGIIHDQLIDHYMDTSQPIIIGKETLLFPVNKDGYIVPSYLLIKILPNLEDGMQFVGFLKEQDEQYTYPYEQIVDSDTTHYLIYKTDGMQNIVGMTQSVYEMYGIHVILTNENSTMSKEFSLDLIIPEINDPKVQKDMATEKGSIVNINTYTIQQHFLISEDISVQDDLQQMEQNEDINQIDGEEDQQLQQQSTIDGDQKNQASTSQLQNQTSLKDPEKQGLLNNYPSSQNNKFESELVGSNLNYRKGQIRINLVQQFQRYGVSLNVLKFKEIREDEDDDYEVGENQIKGHKKNQEDNLGSEMENQENEDDYYDDDQDEKAYQNQLRDENNSVQQNKNNDYIGSSVEDKESQDVKNLKDMRAQIQEKTVPKSIKFLERLVCLIFLAVIGISITSLVLKIQQVNNVEFYVHLMDTAYSRHVVMARLNQYVFDLHSYANYLYIDYPFYSDDLKEAAIAKQQLIKEQIESLENFHYTLEEEQINAEKDFGYTLEDISVTIQELLSNKGVSSSKLTLTQGMEKYITAASSLASMSNILNLNDEINSITANSDYINYYYLKQNGKFELRLGSENNAENVTKMLKNTFSKYQIYIILVLVGICTLLLFSQGCILPVVFKIHKANTNVITLFSLIPIDEVRDLCFKVEQYRKDFVDTQNENIQQSDQQLSKVKIESISQQEQEKNKNVKNQKNVKKQHGDSKESNNMKTKKKQKGGSGKNAKKSNLKKKEQQKQFQSKEQEEEELAQQSNYLPLLLFRNFRMFLFQLITTQFNQLRSFAKS